jgi:chromosome segregation ATPase
MTRAASRFARAATTVAVSRLVVAATTVVVASACDPSAERVDAMQQRLDAMEADLADARAAAKHIAEVRETAATMQTRLADLETRLDGLTALETKLDEKTEALRLEIDQLKLEVAKAATRPPETTKFDGSELTFAKTGIQACDDYVDSYARCVLQHMPESVRETTLDALRQSADAWKTAVDRGLDAEALAESCKNATMAAQRAFEAWGCEI